MRLLPSYQQVSSLSDTSMNTKGMPRWKNTTPKYARQSISAIITEAVVPSLISVIWRINLSKNGVASNHKESSSYKLDHIIPKVRVKV